DPWAIAPRNRRRGHAAARRRAEARGPSSDSSTESITFSSSVTPQLLFLDPASPAALLEGVALDDRHHHGRKAVVSLFEGRQNIVHGTAVVILQTPTEGVSQHLLRERPPEEIGFRQENLA